ncbi:MAG: F0F1 ATP synthase subunit A [Ignavibacteriales bacterium]|nr:F0F1 ATP synthase subunit A [Ignavibacteriales bacterium]
MNNFTTTISDTIQKTSSNQNDWIYRHVLDSKEISFEPMGTIHLPQINLFGIDISITKHVIYLWVASIILIFLLLYVVKSYKRSQIPKGFTNLIEIIIIFVRDEIVKPTIGKYYKRLLPYLLTVFFLIITLNIIGLIPYSSTPTANISVTGTLAIFSFIAIQAGGIIKHGFVQYFKGLVPKGVNLFIAIIIIPIEILSQFIKPFALAIRLFANMTAGHIALLVLLSLIFLFKQYLFAEIFVIPISVLFSLFITMLEILVALIQAYIFTMLTSLFIGLAIYQEH